ncbi:MAG: alkaline phosphatase [Pirellulaceae bacterium]
MSHRQIHRRRFNTHVASLGLAAFIAPTTRGDQGTTTADDKFRPNVTSGVASGDVTSNSAIVWSRTDRPARMIVEVAATESFRNSRRVFGPDALSNQDFTAKLRLTGLPAGQRIFYRVQFQDLDNVRRRSAPVTGQFVTAPADYADVTFAWAGDTAGQGYGIDVSRGGMTTYEAMRRLSPDFFVHSGDTVYSDNPFPAEISLDDGTLWKNLTTEGTSKVAETLDEFRANFRYNLLDENVRRFNAQVPMFAQWDDHETTNNWYPGEQLLDDNRYTVKSASLLAAHARRAFFDYMPIRSLADTQQQIYRTISYGPLLELFFLDLRSHRGANSANNQDQPSLATNFLGTTQLRWLKRSLLNSRATWKVICSDMPLGLIVRDGATVFENGANGDGPPLGRELEIAELLRFIKHTQIRNTVWLTADVHYAASHYYDPQNARFQDFEPFWEFVSGPLHAGTFGPNELDNTFGPEVRFCSVPKGMRPNRPPSEGLQFFGLVHIDGQSRTMSVKHYNASGAELWKTELQPDARRANS